MNSKLETNEVVFYEGRAVEKFCEDQLGRQEFARFFAEAIGRHHGRESLVLAVNAPWGEGKTSFKNMVVDLLAQEQSSRVVILTFTPWEWSSQNQVSEAFFSEIAKQLELKDFSENAKQAAARLRNLGKYLGLAGNLITPAGAFLEAGLPGSTILTLALGRGFSKAREVAKDAADAMEESAKQSKKALPNIKEDLRSALQAYQENESKLILIVIDDIDRLSPDEIRLVFQMIKINADFPALVFLLLYDEQYVISALHKFFGDSSGKYLEKIVQFQTNLPVLIDNRLRDHMAEELKKMFSARPAYSALFDLERFRSLWGSGISHYVTNLRQCGRLLSSFEFHLGIFRTNEAEVNPLDFLVLELFRINERQLHQSLYTNGNRLFPGLEERITWNLRNEGDEKDHWEERLKEFLSSASSPRAGILLRELFPTCGVSSDNYDQGSQKAARERRLCHILYFNRYFRLTVDPDDVKDARITQLILSFDEPTEFVRLLKEFRDENKLALAFTKLLARKPLKPSTKRIEMVKALCNFGDEFGDVKPQAGLIEPLQALADLVRLHIESSLNSADRLTVLSEGIRQSIGVHLPILLAQLEDMAEHAYTGADTYQRKHFGGPHLERSDVEKLNLIASRRFEQSVREKRLQLTNAWVCSTRWHIHFVPSESNRGFLLASPSGVAVVLLVILADHSVKHYDIGYPDEHFAREPLLVARTRFGINALDAAINDFESELIALGDSIAGRITIYRDMCKHFINTVEPVPPASS